MPAFKLTKRAVEAQPVGLRDLILWDTELKGFGCKITPKGKRVYFLYYRTATGTQRRPSIGTHGAVTTERAREIAKSWLGRVAAGDDPSLDRQTLRNAPTMADLCQRFLQEHSVHRNKRGTYYNYGRLIERFVIPTLGRRKVLEITRTDIDGLHRQLRETPYQANRVLGLLSRMLNLAEKWGLRPDGSNPTLHAEKYREHRRERYLSKDELGRLSQTLLDAEIKGTEPPSAIAAIRLLIFTGCRLSEILTLRWEWINFDRQRLELPESKTGAKWIYLNQPAAEILGALARDPENPHVIGGAKAGQHLVNLEKPWRRIRRAAGLVDLRIHDLRHSFASVAAGLGEGLPMIGKLLGHTQAQTTHRYAHLAEDPVKIATERIGSAIATIMSAKNERTG